MKKFLLASGILLLPQFVFAKQLTFPDTFEVLKVNGQPYKSSFFESETELTLGSGRHIIEYRYSEIFEDDDVDDHIKIKSEPFVLDINLGQREIAVKNPNNLDIEQAKAYANKPELTLLGVNDTNQLDYKIISKIDYEQMRYQGLLNTSEAVKRNLPAKTSTSTDIGLTAGQKVNSRAVEMLNYWWQQASEQERAAFLSQLKGDK